MQIVPLYQPFIPNLPEIDVILHSGKLAFGEYGREFEGALNSFFSTQNALVTNTFNTAISVALAAFDIVPGDEVIASPMACLASTQPYHSSGLRVVWADIDRQSGTLDPDAVKKRITKRTKAIIHNHFCGYPGYIDEINALGKEYGIAVFDDGIECFGSEYKGKKIGSCGTDATLFSFNPVRIPTTVDGGALLLSDRKVLEKAVLIRDCGIDRKRFRDEMGEINEECDISLTGFSATMSDVNAYIGCRQMADVSDIIGKHRANAAVWDKLLEEDRSIVPLTTDNRLPNYWVYGTLTENKRQTIERFRKAGIYASGVHINNNRYSVFGKAEPLPGVEYFYNRFVALPCGWWTNEEELKLRWQLL